MELLNKDNRRGRKKQFFQHTMLIKRKSISNTGIMFSHRWKCWKTIFRCGYSIMKTVGYPPTIHNESCTQNTELNSVFFYVYSENLFQWVTFPTLLSHLPFNKNLRHGIAAPHFSQGLLPVHQGVGHQPLSIYSIP